MKYLGVSNFTAYFIILAVLMLLYFDASLNQALKNKNYIDSLERKISLFKVVVELFILLLFRVKQ